MCCGNRHRTNPRQRRSLVAPRKLGSPNIIPVIQKSGMVMLQFLGAGNGTRTFFGQSGTRYLFGGKNHELGYVLSDDVVSMLEMRENSKPIFEVVTPPKPPEPVKVPELKVEPVIVKLTTKIEPVKVEEQAEPDEIVAPVKKPRKKKVVE